MPVYNASCWLKECLQAILNQDFPGSMELSVFDDASTVCVFVTFYSYSLIPCETTLCLTI